MGFVTLGIPRLPLPSLKRTYPVGVRLLLKLYKDAKMQVKLAGTDGDILRCYPVMVQLRPTFTETAFLERVRQQQQEAGYQLAYIESGLSTVAGSAPVAAVAGFVVRHFLSGGHVLYVDDLVTDTHHRSGGYGAALLDWLEAHARALGCDVLDLDSGVQRYDAHRFYFRQRMHIFAYHFRRVLREPD